MKTQFDEDEIEELSAQYDEEFSEIQTRMQRAGDGIRDDMARIARLQLRHMRKAFGVSIGSLVWIDEGNGVETGLARVVGFAPSEDGIFDPRAKPVLRVHRKTKDGEFDGRGHNIREWHVKEPGPVYTDKEKELLVLLRSAEGRAFSRESMQSSGRERQAKSLVSIRHVERRSDRYVLAPGV